MRNRSATGALRVAAVAALLGAVTTVHAQRAVGVPRVPTPSIRTPVIVVPQGVPAPSLPDLKSAPVVEVPQGAVVLVPVPPRAREDRSSQNCTVAEEKCATLCYPHPQGWSSYRQCLGQFCRIEDQSCIEALVDLLGK